MNQQYQTQQIEAILSQRQAAIIIQKFYRGYRSRASTKIIFKRFSQRKKIIEQLVVTEEKYIHDLGIIVSDFQMHLFNQNIITKDQSYSVFSNIDAIRKLNEHFFTIVYNNFQNYWHYKVVFEQAKKETCFFKIYFEYLNNFTVSMAEVKKLKQSNETFKDFILKIRKNKNYGNLDLEDFLIKPVQRLPKYVLLFKQLLKKTPNEHPDFHNIKRVLQSFEQVNFSNNQKLNKLVNNFRLSELEKLTSLPFHITEPGTEFIMEETVNVLNSSSQVQDVIMYLLNNRVFLTKKSKSQQKFVQSVNFRYGASIMQNQDQQLYQHCFTVQSTDGDSITFLCQSQGQKCQLINKIQEQIAHTEKKAFQKYSALQINNQITQSFLKRISRFDMMPEICILGTEQRTDKMLKYTTYIVEVKVKNVKQKIFLRFSELLAIQSLINIQFPNVEIKQSLYKTTWLLNHKPRTIEQRKMSIQRFLKEVLSKPEIIQSGSRILSKLGLPEDLYFLPEKLKGTESFLKKSTLCSKLVKNQSLKIDNQGRTANSSNFKTRKTYRLSIFQDLQDDQYQPPRKYTLNENIKSVKSSTNRRKFNLEQILYANEIDLGHYIRYSQNIEGIARNKIKVQISLPWIQDPKGYIKKTIEIFQCQRVSVLINKLAKEINLNYYKDFRLFLQKQYFQRVLDDDEIILKIENQIFTGKFELVFKKMIYIDQQSEENEIKNDRLRLKLISSQIIYQVKKSKYRINYNKFLILSVLIGIIQHENKNQIHVACQRSRQTLKDNPSQFKQKVSSQRTINRSGQMRLTFQMKMRKNQPEYKQLAISCRQLLANPYASFFENDQVWIRDFTETYKRIHSRLKSIAKGNSMLVRTSNLYSDQQEDIWTSLEKLSYIAIIDQIKGSDLFGSMCYVVQISEQFRQILVNSGRDQEQIDFDIKTKENRNVWLVIRCDQIYLYSINLRSKLYQIEYSHIEKITCYPSSVIIYFNSRFSQIQTLKLKTTNSFCIRELLNYYKNYTNLSKKIQQNQEYSDSIIQMIQENGKIQNFQEGISQNNEYQEEHL